MKGKTDWYWLCQNDTPVCPYCEEKYDDQFHDHDDFELECGKCEKPFKVTTVQSVKYDTHGICNEPHKLYKYEGSPGPYTCQECYREFYDFNLPDGQYPKLKEGDFVILSREDVGAGRDLDI